MIYLYGFTTEYFQKKIGGPFEESTSEEALASFDTIELAEAYVKGSRLKNPKRKTFSGARPFKVKSLLSGCSDYEIREEAAIVVPHNPKI